VLQKVESKERNMVLTILRTTGVVTLIAEDKVGGIRKSVVLPTRTLMALLRLVLTQQVNPKTDMGA
jgi:hypothetical protein